MFPLVWVFQNKNFKAVFVSPKEGRASIDSHLFSLANLFIKFLFFFHLRCWELSAGDRWIYQAPILAAIGVSCKVCVASMNSK